jgi:aerobic-type carbon monoxide dehydrogenase small subunit (CoxS/CutS family)
MSDKEHPEQRPGVSRRSFLKGVSIGGGAAFVGVSAGSEAQEKADAPEGLKHYPADGARITLNVNGKDRTLKVTPDTTLLAAVREQLDLTGSKEVCDRGACGACTVLVDGKSVNSCLMLAIDAVGKKVVTVEGLAKDGKLNHVQQAFADNDACQCGYCIPGFVVRAQALLDETPHPDLEQVKEGLSGNICRCGTYVKIHEAVEAAGRGGTA